MNALLEAPTDELETTTADVRLLERIRSGDAAAMAELYDATSAQAFGLAFKTLRDRTAAEDVVQDAYVTLWKQGPRLDPARGRVQSLLMTIVHRRAIDAIRARQARPTSAPFDISVLQLPQRGPSTVEVVTAGESREAVRRVVAALPKVQRQTVLLAYFEGVTHVEIARIMGVPAGTVKSRLRLALEKMRLHLSSEMAC